MTDIRVQLHKAAFGPVHERSTVLLCSAIDEIDRLRAEVESLQRSGIRLCQRNDDLRAALERLTEDPPATLDEPDTDCEVIAKLGVENGRLRDGLTAAIRAAKLALFVINKQGVMPNSSWESGFKSDLDKATAARDAP